MTERMTKAELEAEVARLRAEAENSLVPITTRIPRALAADLQARSIETGLTMQQVITDALRAHLTKK